jgi:hypothetical protein
MSGFNGIYSKDMPKQIFPSTITTSLAQRNNKLKALTKLVESNKSKPRQNNTSKSTSDTIIESLKGLFSINDIDIYIKNGLPVMVKEGTQVIGRGFFGFGSKLTKPLIGKIKSYNHTNMTVTIISCDKTSKQQDGKEIKISDVTFPRNKEDIDRLLLECNKVSGGTRKQRKRKQQKCNKRTRRN